jgi:RimJ/RimL family protein N-acetyltransferase
MVHENIIDGKNIYFRTVNENDAEYILSLRLNENLNRFLNEVSASVEDQKDWITKQKEKPGDYYFIIMDKKIGAIGTIGVYDIDNIKGSFNWGRWILSPKAPVYALIESTILAYEFGFSILNLEKAISDVRIGNYKVINFHLSYNATIHRVDEKSVYYNYNKNQFNDLKNKYKGFIK